MNKQFLKDALAWGFGRWHTGRLMAAGGLQPDLPPPKVCGRGVSCHILPG